ncbi:MAG: enoyl-CoA hydratase-related protein [Thermodesulfobacteriota bacterium]
MGLVRYEKKGGVAYILLDRSEANPINREMTVELGEIWEDFQGDPDLLVGILGTTRKNFCVGFDIKEMAGLMMQGVKYSWTDSAIFGRRPMSPDVRGVTKPVIGAFDGNVNGAGFWLFLQSDIRIATPETRFGLGEARINFPIEFVALLPRYLPRAIIGEMIYTGLPLPAQRLYDLGVVNRLTAREKLLDEAAGLAEIVRLSGPLAVEAMKRLLDWSHDAGRHSLMAFTGRLIEPVVNAEDTSEALAAFVEKRPPVWKRR